MERLKPGLNALSIIGLLFTLIVMFSLKGDLILERPAIVVEMAIPMTIFFGVMFFVVLGIGSRLGFGYEDGVAVAFNTTGRDFEIAIAIAITAFSPTVALATVVSRCVEVPVMLFLVWVGRATETTPLRRHDWRGRGPRFDRLDESGDRALMIAPGTRAAVPAWAAPRSAGPRHRASAGIAALIGDPVRAGILAILRDGPHCVCEMAAALDVRQNNLSNHLAKLREAGLVRTSRHAVDARWVYYERDEEALAAAGAALREVLG